MKEKYPKYFLGNTVEEAERIHNEYIGILNNIAKRYSLYTGLDKKDLFNEALFGLASAVKKYDGRGGYDFKKFAIFKIKDYLNSYVRKYSSTISIPKYINQAINVINKIYKILEAYGDYEYIPIFDLIRYKEIYDLNLTDQDLLEYEQYINKLNNIAQRASISIDKLLKRVEFIPTYSEENIESISNKVEENYELQNLLNKLHDQERTIAIKLLENKTYAEIASEMGKSKTWVFDRIKNIREKIGENNEEKDKN